MSVVDPQLERQRLKHLVTKVIEPDYAPATRRFVVGCMGALAVLEAATVYALQRLA